MPEKTINEISADARRLFTKATEAAQRENADYAIALYCQILEKEPGFIECRRLLRAEQQQKAGAGGGGFFKKMMSGAGSSPQIAKAKMIISKSPAEAMAVAEQVLNTDPNSLAALRIVADAAIALELPQTSAFALETMVKISPKDKALVIEYSERLSESGGDTRNGERALQELIRTSGYDSDLNQALKNLSARTTMDEGGYNAAATGKASFRDMLKNKDEAVLLEQQNRIVKNESVADRLIGEYQTRLQTEPNNLKIMRELAKLYAEKNQFPEAFELFNKLKASDMANDPALDRAIGEATIKQFDFQISQINPFAPDHAEQVAKLTTDKQTFQLDDCQKRVERYPTDLALRFELGVLYFRVGKYAEAIAELQKAQQNPHKKLSAMNYLAQCYAKRKMYDFAARTFQNAIKEKPTFDEEKKELVYNLGLALEAMGKKEEAIEQFKLLYELDISYKDVAAKVDAYYAAQ
ncbi:MAG TPA: tetratricopeptide repeat protein [Verrucomicrobiae bacterium]|jgi:tetratricopeptide (TPR) repeat protein